MRVLVTDATMIQNLDRLQELVEGEVHFQAADGDQAQLLEQLRTVDVFVGSPFTGEMAAAAPRLRLIQLPGAGTGGIAFDSLPPSVTVANTYNHERSIAEYVLMCMLALSRRLRTADNELREGRWYAVRHDSAIPLPATLEGQTVGIVGFGHIGQQVAALARCLGMRLLAIKRQPDPALAEQYGLELLGGPADLPRLLQEADYLVIATPQTPETEGLIDAAALGSMKPTAYLINVARGAIVDEDALYDALAANRIAGAAIDTWYQYPGSDGRRAPATRPFHELDNIIMTPHTSGETAQTINGRIADIAANINHLQSGRPLINVVHP